MARIPHVNITAENGGSIPEDILRNLETVLGTRKGEQETDRTLGVDWDALDRPPHEARRILTLDLVEQVMLADTRCRVVRVEFDFEKILTGAAEVKVVIEVIA